MNKLVVLLLALLFIVPLIGCGSSEESSKPVNINGKAPDANQEGSRTAPGGQAAQETL